MRKIFNHNVRQVKYRKDYLLALLLILISAFSAEAQLRLQQLPRAMPTSKKNAVARKQADPIQLPFFDDFSFTPVLTGESPTGGAVLLSLWDTASYSVYVNPGSGINPPSVNVATLDGLNRKGERYSEQQLNNGFADTLLSRPIDLSILSVSLAERSTTMLSFFYQRGGFAEIPDPKDYLQLEFKKNDGTWVQIDEFREEDAPKRDTFYLALIPIPGGDVFFHDQFQFRIRNFGRLSGPFDAWNVDHIYLDKGRKVDMDIPEITLTRQPTPLFFPYHSMPLTHFRETSHLEPVQSTTFGLWGPGEGPIDDRPTTNYTTIAWFHNFMEDGSIRSDSVHLNPARALRLGNEESSRLLQFEYLDFTMDILPDPTNEGYFDPDAKRIDIEWIFAIDSVLTEKPWRIGKQHLVFKNNDTTRTTYHLDDYYAYDDGSAEYAAVLTNPGVRVAYAFDMIRTSEEPEFINGFDVYFPKWGQAQNVSPSFYIYDDDNGIPGEILWAISSLPISTLEQNQFQFVPIYESVMVNKRFYIGWEAPVTGLIAVGVDYNNNTGDKILYQANGAWNVNDAVLGSLMIRPHMGEGVISGIPEETKAARAYPNPSGGTFYIDDEVTVLDVLSVSGQKIPVTFRWESNQTRISLNEPAPGMYILRTQKGNRVNTQKIVVTNTF